MLFPPNTLNNKVKENLLYVLTRLMFGELRHRLGTFPFAARCSLTVTSCTFGNTRFTVARKGESETLQVHPKIC